MVIILLFLVIPMTSIQASETVILKGDGHSMRHLTREAYDRQLAPQFWESQTRGQLELGSKKLRQNQQNEDYIIAKAETKQRPWDLTDQERNFRTNLAMFSGPAFITAYGA